MVIHIPIGEDCNSAFYLDKKGLRKEAYTFDWVISSPLAIRDLFKSDFAEYMLKENMKFIRKKKRKPKKNFKQATIEVIDARYDIVYPHHFDNIDKDYQHVYDTFQRRLERMRRHFINKEPVIFYYNNLQFLNETKPCKNYSFGEEYIDQCFSDIKDILMSRYQYKEDDITLIKQSWEMISLVLKEQN